MSAHDENSHRVWVSHESSGLDVSNFLAVSLENVTFVLGTAQLPSSHDGTGQCAWPDRGWSNRGEFERELRAGLEQRAVGLVARKQVGGARSPRPCETTPA